MDISEDIYKTYGMEWKDSNTDFQMIDLRRETFLIDFCHPELLWYYDTVFKKNHEIHVSWSRT